MQFFIKNYGEVEYVGLHTEKAHRIAFVVFREPNDARRAAVFTAHTIAGHVVDVKTPEIVAQPPNLLSMPDDCVKDIMRQLELRDLCSIAGVCQRFNALAKAVFKPKWKDLRLTVNDVRDLQECVRCFGAEIQSICLKPSENLQKSHHNSVLNVLVEHCSGTLTSLEMINFTFEMNCAIITESRSLLTGLKKMVLHKCTVSVKWFVECRELVELELIDSHVTYNGAQYQSCPKLETLKIYGSKSWVDYGLHLFLDQNTQLRTLEVLPLQTATNRSHHSYGDILYCVPKSIENLTIVPTVSTRLDHLPAVKTLHLKGIYLNKNAASVINQMRNATIEHLEIDMNYYAIDRQNAEAIGKLKKINTLKMHCSGGCSSVDLLCIVRNLYDLSDLALSTHSNILSAFNILTIIALSPNLQRLCISFADNGDDKNQLQMNEQMYHHMLDAVLRRSNGKSLCVVIVGRHDHITNVNVAFPMHTALKMVCLSVESVATLLQIKKDYYLQQHIKMTDDILNELRDLGLCP